MHVSIFRATNWDRIENLDLHKIFIIYLRNNNILRLPLVNSLISQILLFDSDNYDPTANQ